MLAVGREVLVKSGSASMLCQDKTKRIGQSGFANKDVIGAPVCGTYGRCFAVVNSHSFSDVFPDLVQMSALKLGSQALLVRLPGLAATDAPLAHSLCFATHKCQVMHYTCSVEEREALKTNVKGRVHG